MPTFSVYMKLVTITGFIFSIIIVPFALIYAVLVGKDTLLSIIAAELISSLLMSASISLLFFFSGFISYQPIKYLVRKGFLEINLASR